MASQVTTLLDIAKANGADAAVGLIEEVLTVAPEVTSQFSASRTIKGTSYKTLVRTTLPTAAFRNANEGTAAVKSLFDNRVVECFTLNPYWYADKAVADRYEDGAAAYIALEADAIMRAAMITLGKQFYYGNTAGSFGDVKGFPGLLNMYDATNMTVDATGTTANTGASVWAVKFSQKDVTWVFGENGQLAVSDVRVQTMLDTNSNPYTAYVQELLAYPGLQLGNIKCVGRIKNITAESGKGLTDALLSKLLAKFPVGYKPDAFFMSRRSLQQLQTSRTATTPTGVPAPYPDSAFDVPIVPTDSIQETEAIA